ncbi:MAG: hypothetical protein ACI4DO_03755 [Roseburia sp.]
MGKLRCVTYTENDKEIVREGITSIQRVLLGEDMDRKRSLLFCLDWYMDPYYGQDISGIKDELINLLQVVVITCNDIDVKEDALQLLEDYTWGPYQILEDHFDDIENEVRSDAEYIINMHRIAKIEQLMVSECKRIYEDEKKECNDISSKVWILHNKNLTEEENEPDIETTWLLENGTINSTAAYLGSTFSQFNENGFFINPEMHFNIFLQEKRILVAYYFGKRFARCIEYDLNCINDEYSIDNPKVIWVG